MEMFRKRFHGFDLEARTLRPTGNAQLPDSQRDVVIFEFLFGFHNFL